MKGLINVKYPFGEAQEGIQKARGTPECYTKGEIFSKHTRRIKYETLFYNVICDFTTCVGDDTVNEFVESFILKWN